MANDDNVEEMSTAMNAALRDAVDNIMFHKSQQWRIAHYTILVYAVVITIAQITENTSSVENVLLTLIASVASVGSIIVISRLQVSQTKFRKRIKYMYVNFFTTDQREEMGLSLETKSFWYHSEVLFTLYVASTLGVAITIYLIWRPEI